MLEEIAWNMATDLGVIEIFAYINDLEYYLDEKRNSTFMRETIEANSIPNLKSNIDRNKIDIQEMLESGCDVPFISKKMKLESKEIELFIKLMELRIPKIKEKEKVISDKKEEKNPWDGYSNLFVFSPSFSNQKEKSKNKKQRKKKKKKKKKEDPSLVLSWNEFNMLWNDYKREK